MAHPGTLNETFGGVRGGKPGRWLVAIYEAHGERQVLAIFPNQATADAYAVERGGSAVHVEFDPVVSWGDGKKSRYGPTYASQVRDIDWGTA